jgi:HK97 family phage major capsid protein
LDHIAAANAALEKRKALFEQRSAVAADNTLSVSEKRSRVEALDKELEALGKEAEAHVRAAEHEAEIRALNERAALLVAGGRAKRDEWDSVIPTRKQYRAALNEGTDSEGGVTVPTRTRNTYIDLLRARSAFLRIPGLNIVPMDTDLLRLPRLTDIDDVSGPTAEGTTISELDAEWDSGDLQAFGYKAILVASNEILDDSALPLRRVMAQEAARQIAKRIDADALGSSTSGRILGLLAVTDTANGTSSQHTKVQLDTGFVTWDEIVEAVSDIDAQGGEATAVLAGATAAKSLRLLKDNDGRYMAGSPSTDVTRRAVGLPLLVSAALPANDVLVVDGNRLYYGLRSTSVKVSEDAYFTTDQTGVRVVQRAAGVVVAEPESVVWIAAPSE